MERGSVEWNKAEPSLMAKKGVKGKAAKRKSAASEQVPEEHVVPIKWKGHPKAARLTLSSYPAYSTRY